MVSEIWVYVVLWHACLTLTLTFNHTYMVSQIKVHLEMP